MVTQLQVQAQLATISSYGNQVWLVPHQWVPWCFELKRRLVPLQDHNTGSPAFQHLAECRWFERPVCVSSKQLLFIYLLLSVYLNLIFDLILAPMWFHSFYISGNVNVQMSPVYKMGVMSAF